MVVYLGPVGPGLTRLQEKESIANYIDTLRAMDGFLNEVVRALDLLKDMKPPPGFRAEPD